VRECERGEERGYRATETAMTIFQSGVVKSEDRLRSRKKVLGFGQQRLRFYFLHPLNYFRHPQLFKITILPLGKVIWDYIFRKFFETNFWKFSEEYFKNKNF